ncbi:hypothetical protein ABZY06_33855 [Streptomyces sp. NPDC006540]|uniref:hypothetical protein n=1 Tax=Streptomyces sp. NPDC006540 TaxID=3155353 RepID=UPI0033A792E4
MKRVEVTYVTHEYVLQTLEFFAGNSTIKEAAATAARGVEYAKNADRMITLSLIDGTARSVWADDIREVIVTEVEE